MGRDEELAWSFDDRALPSRSGPAGSLWGGAWRLERRHGLSRLRHGGPGLVVADVEAGRTLLDLARFELEAESLLGPVWP